MHRKERRGDKRDFTAEARRSQSRRERDEERMVGTREDTVETREKSRGEGGDTASSVADVDLPGSGAVA